MRARVKYGIADRADKQNVNEASISNGLPRAARVPVEQMTDLEGIIIASPQRILDIRILFCSLVDNEAEVAGETCALAAMVNLGFPNRCGRARARSAKRARIPTTLNIYVQPFLFILSRRGETPPPLTGANTWQLKNTPPSSNSWCVA